MNIANEILQQLGGNKFIVMTGSSKFTSDGNTLGMKLTTNKAKAQYLHVTLNAMDTYDLTFFSITKNFDKVIKATFEGAYNDMLQDIFTKITGLYTHL